MGYTARRVAVLHHLAAWKNYKHIVLQFNEPPQRCHAISTIFFLLFIEKNK